MRPVEREIHNPLLTADRSTTLTFEPPGDGKVRVRTSGWDHEVMVLGDQALYSRQGQAGYGGLL